MKNFVLTVVACGLALAAGIALFAYVFSHTFGS
jgi:hypothetical protein